MSKPESTIEAVDRRATLRSATSGQHAALDLIGDKLGHFAHAAGYRLWLQGMYRFHREMEEVLGESSDFEALPCAALRRRAALLRQDLADLRQEVPDNLPSATWKATRPEAMGILYVTEGASLGARLLIIQARKLGFSADHGARNLAYAADSLETWRSVLAILSTFEGNEEDDLKMITAAQRAFAVATIHLSGQI